MGGWGVVLLVPGHPDAFHQGQVRITDNGACELLAVLEAVRLAPAGQPLTVHTDATCAVQAVKRGTLHPEQSELGAQVRRVAHDRGIALKLSLGPRDARRMREAHQLASDARLGVPSQPLDRPHVRVRVRRLAWGARVTLTFRRGGSTRHVDVPLPAQEGVPPAVLALAELVRRAHDGEHLSVRMDSTLAPTFWKEPQHATHAGARSVLDAARADATHRNISLEFI